jgi:hypothetical protein
MSRIVTTSQVVLYICSPQPNNQRQVFQHTRDRDYVTLTLQQKILLTCEQAAKLCSKVLVKAGVWSTRFTETGFSTDITWTLTCQQAAKLCSKVLAKVEALPHSHKLRHAQLLVLTLQHGNIRRLQQQQQRQQEQEQRSSSR